MKVLIFLGFFISGVLAFAKNSINWEVEGPYRVSSPDGFVSGFVIQRQIKVGDLPVNTMTVSFSEHPMKNPMTEKQLAADLAKTLKIGAWKVTREKDFYIFDQSWPAQNRYLRLFVKTEKSKVIFSMASARTAFLFPSMVEAEWLQRKWVTKNKNKKTAENFFWNLVIPKAYAADPLADLIREIAGTTGDGIREGAAAIGAKFDGISNNIGEVAAGTKDISGSIDRLADKLSLGNVAKAAAVGGFAGVLGSSLGHFVIDGSLKAVKEIYYGITGKIRPEDESKIDALTRKSLENLDSLHNEIVAMEKTIDADLWAMSYVQKTSPDRLLLDLQTDISVAEQTIADLKRSLANAKDEEARKICQNRLEVWENIKAALSKASNVDTQAVCQNLKMSLNKYTQAQYNLWTAKENLKNHMTVIMNNQLDRGIEALDPIASIRRQETECNNRIDLLERRQASLSSSNSSAAQEIRIRLQQMRQDCVESARLQRDVNPEATFLEMVKKAQANQQVLREFHKSLVMSDCKSEIRSDLCDGRPGFFQAKESYHREQKEKFDRFCPQTSGLKTSSAPPPSASLAVPDSAPVVGENPVSKGVSGIFSKFKSFISGFFKSQDSMVAAAPSNPFL